MNKRSKIIYWIATVWLSLGMVSSGIMQLIQEPEIVENMERLGYPVYFITIIAIWKILGVIAILVPKFPLVKEWAYAGFFFTMTGAIISHISISDPITEVLPGILLVALIIVSWYFRPESRKLAPKNG